MVSFIPQTCIHTPQSAISALLAEKEERETSILTQPSWPLGTRGRGYEWLLKKSPGYVISRSVPLSPPSSNCSAWPMARRSKESWWPTFRIKETPEEEEVVDRLIFIFSMICTSFVIRQAMKEWKWMWFVNMMLI